MADPIRLDGTHRVSGVSPAAPQRTSAAPGAGQPSFADVLARAGEVKFSNHAQKRLENRQIALTEDGLARLALAVDKANQRGGKESLVLMDDMAFIVNVRDRLIVTALDGESRRDGVFTQIDSVVFAEPAKNA